MASNSDTTFMRALKKIYANIDEVEPYEDLYRALCNVEWVHQETGRRWSCSWRYAGTVAAVLRGAGEDYLDYYASVDEGTIAPWLREALAECGWTPMEEPEVQFC